MTCLSTHIKNWNIILAYCAYFGTKMFDFQLCVLVIFLSDIFLVMSLPDRYSLKCSATVRLIFRRI